MRKFWEQTVIGAKALACWLCITCMAVGAWTIWQKAEQFVIDRRARLTPLTTQTVVISPNWQREDPVRLAKRR
jgi:hypothetical protein